ncbi:unnamed protein product [Ranitomeya imitator]|uniref:CRIB domain-containing protein n=1 Tax=Ranitomeya imitator TaxID=111125 RepID=A0ABN9KWC6_9NEOB|nr:unnamed protein product [Ranitomeya imitator]
MEQIYYGFLHLISTPFCFDCGVPNTSNLKMPILKQSSSNSKKRTRIDREMISAPLGDFRHTMHVGRGGDVFGDTSFLSNHGPSSAPPVEVPKKNGLLKMTGEHEENKMADSLSQLSQSSGIGSGAGSVSSSPVNNVSSKEDRLWSNSNTGRNNDQFDWISPGDCGLKHAESMLSFHLDLGPSILDDVLGVMDRDPPVPECGAIQMSREILTLNLRLSMPRMTIEKEKDQFTKKTARKEEEKRSIYEGIADSPVQHDNSLHISHRAELDNDDDERR